MAASKARWRAIDCVCGGDIMVWVEYHSPKFSIYNYECAQCGRAGRWNDLAKEYVRSKRWTD